MQCVHPVLRAALIVVSLSLTVHAATPASWLLPTSGSWRDVTKWSTNPVYPNNGSPGAADAYDVTIGATGAPYTVTLNLFPDVTITRLTIASPDATFSAQPSGTFSVIQGIDVQAGTFALQDFNTSLSGGDISVHAGAHFRWTSGLLSGPGTLNIDPGASMSIRSNVDLLRSMTNAGTLDVGVAGDSEGFRLRTGTFTNQADAVARFIPMARPIAGPDVQYTSNVVNHGRLVFNSGGTFGSVGTLSRHGYINTGTVEIAAGSINFDWSGWTFQDGAVLTGNGFARMGPVNVIANGNVRFDIREIELNGAFSGNGTLTIATGTKLQWNGSMIGTGCTVFEPGTVVRVSTSQSSQIARRVENFGSLTMTEGTITFNNGTLLNQANGTVQFERYELRQNEPGRGFFVNEGITRVASPQGAMLTARTSIINNGTFHLQGGMFMHGVSSLVEFRNTGTFLNDGGLTVNMKPGTSDGGNIDGNGTLTVQQGSVFELSRVRQTGLAIASQARVTLKPNGADNNVSRVASLDVNLDRGTLDLNDNDLICDPQFGGSPYLLMRIYLSKGRSGGTWTGDGVTSTAAANDPTHTTTLGLLSGAQYKQIYGPGATFDGFAVSNDAAIVKYTCYGDSDFNGIVNFDDYARIDAGFNAGGNMWFQGDFDNNNQINFDDYSLIDLAFNTQSGTLVRAMDYLEGEDRSLRGMDGAALRMVVDHFDQFGTAYATSFLSSVPEPTQLSWVLGTVALARKRKR